MLVICVVDEFEVRPFFFQTPDNPKRFGGMTFTASARQVFKGRLALGARDLLVGNAETAALGTIPYRIPCNEEMLFDFPDLKFLPNANILFYFKGSSEDPDSPSDPADSLCD